MCRMCPPPTAYPATMATTGLGMRRIWIWRSSTLSRGTLSAPTYPPFPRTDWSPPEQKASVPSPARTTTPTAGSSRASAKHRDISSTVRGVKAFRFSGRLMLTFATPSPTALRYTTSRSACPPTEATVRQMTGSLETSPWIRS